MKVGHYLIALLLTLLASCAPAVTRVACIDYASASVFGRLDVDFVSLGGICVSDPTFEEVMTVSGAGIRPPRGDALHFSFAPASRVEVHLSVGAAAGEGAAEAFTLSGSSLGRRALDLPPNGPVRVVFDGDDIVRLVVAPGASAAVARVCASTVIAVRPGR